MKNTDSNGYYGNSPKNIKNVSKKKKRHINKGLVWLILFIAAACFFVSFWGMPMFPRKWSFIVLGVLLVILLFTGLCTSKAKRRGTWTKVLNSILAVFLFIGSAAMPYYTDKISSLFTSAVGNTITINLYVMTADYKAEHTDLFTDSNTISVPSDGQQVSNLDDYTNAVYGTSSSVDEDNQSYAISQLRKDCGSSVKLINSESVADSAAALYSNKTDIMVMAQSYAATISDIAGYENFDKDTQILYSYKREIKASSLTANTELTTKPFTIFIAGNDQTGDLSLEGRTDVDMIITADAVTGQCSIVNLPRDSYVANPYYDDDKDKLTHLGLKGIDNTLKGTSNLLNVDISSYMIVNFDTFMEIISALGNITIDNPYAFTAIDGQSFAEGSITLDAAGALMYCRERENLPDGDFGRNAHQQIVMKAIISKLTSADVITHFDSLLTSLNGKFLTNLSSDSIYALCQKQLNDSIDWNIVTYHVEGTTGYEECASATGQNLSVVYPYTNQIEFVSKVMKQIIAGDTVEQEELPEGSFKSSDSDN
jgi:LCP family protein required for cell wall assembly